MSDPETIRVRGMTRAVAQDRQLLPPVASFEQRMEIVNKSKKKKEKMRKTFDLYDEDNPAGWRRGLKILFNITDEGLIIDVMDDDGIIATVGRTADEWAELVCDEDI